MHLNEYHVLAQRTAKQYDTQIENLNHAALGMATEFLESMVATEPEHIKEEVTDFVWYIPVACEALGFKMGNLMAEYMGVDVEHVTAAHVQGALPEDLTDPIMSIRDCGAKAAGDFITMVKRLKIYEKPLTDAMVLQAKQDLVHMILWAAAMADRNDQTFASWLRFNIDKLKDRFPDAYSDAAAEARADKHGLDARVS